MAGVEDRRYRGETEGRVGKKMKGAPRERRGTGLIRPCVRS